MPRKPNNLREQAIGMLDAGMSTEHVARHVGCSSRIIRNIRVRFRTKAGTNDLPHRGRPRVTTRGQDRYIMNTHLRNRFQTATATAANTPGLHNNRTSAQTVRNRLRENGLHAQRPYVGCGLTQRHRQNHLNWACVHTLAGIPFFFRMNQYFLYNVVVARCACTVGEMNAMLTVVFLNEIVSGWTFFHGLGSHSPWLSFTNSRHWWQFKCSTVPRWHSRSSRHSSGP